MCKIEYGTHNLSIRVDLQDSAEQIDSNIYNKRSNPHHTEFHLELGALLVDDKSLNKRVLQFMNPKINLTKIQRSFSQSLLFSTPAVLLSTQSNMQQVIDD